MPYIDFIHKWHLSYYSFANVHISLPSLILEQEFFSIRRTVLRPVASQLLQGLTWLETTLTLNKRTNNRNNGP